jgi:hypothetical protein
MRIPYVLIGAALPLLLVVAACSDANETTTGTATTTSRQATPAPTTTASASAVAGANPEYRLYVSDVCQAGAAFKDGLADVADDVRNDPSNAFDEVKGPFEKLRSDLDSADPPADLRSWHQQILAKLDTTTDALEKQDLSALAQVFESPFPPPPSGAEDRLREAARDNPDCSDAGLFD